jgi:hypothetical protein
MAGYAVREAVLVKASEGSVWRVTFAPVEGDGDTIMVEVTPATLERMSFAAPYTLAEIETLRGGHV